MAPTISDTTIHSTLSSPIGDLLLIATPTGLIRLAFADDDWNLILASLSVARPEEEADVDEVVSDDERAAERNLKKASDQLDSYFEGERKAFDLPLDLSLVKGFRRDVVEHLVTIPFGTTETYGEVAESLNNPNAVRAVGSACSNNPMPIVIPCHRVLRSDGRVGGYLGGTSIKEYLLRHEGALH